MSYPHCRISLLRTALLTLVTATSWGTAAIIPLTGSDFAGGGRERFGHEYRGERNVTAIYARPTGSMSRLTAAFQLSETPATPMILLVRGRDDDRPGACGIVIEINGKPIFAGENPFPEADFGDHPFPIPENAMKAGENEITIQNTETEGSAGNPPWFMLARATISSPAALPLTSNFNVVLPEEERPFPEPAAPGASQFKIRGTKGWAWTTQQYLDEIPHLRRAGMNFLMNCYFSMFEGVMPAGVGWDDKQVRNNWWEPFSQERKRGIERIVKACEANGITFCFAMHPQIFSARPMNLESDEDFERFFTHFAWVQSLGVKWFSVSMDDVKQEHAGKAHAAFCNKFLKRLREKDPEAQLVFCPTVYANSMIGNHDEYLPTLAREMDADVYVFWTGPEVVPLTMSRADAERFRDLVKHRLIIWDNYPVNDNSRTLHLGPITGRDPELCKVADGYMGNALYPQSQANRLPLYTMGDFASNPYGYEPSRSIGQAILHLSSDTDEQRLLTELVSLYSGNLIYANPSTAFNPPRHEYERLTASPAGADIGAMYLAKLDAIASRGEASPSPLTAEILKALRADLAFLYAQHTSKYGTMKPNSQVAPP